MYEAVVIIEETRAMDIHHRGGKEGMVTLQVEKEAMAIPLRDTCHLIPDAGKVEPRFS